MIDIFKVFGNGRLTKDADLSFSGTGTAICKFSIASNGYKDSVSYFNIVAFGKLAENIGKYLTKGKSVTIDGKLQQDRYTDKEGKNKSSVSIIAENIQLHSNSQQSSNNAPQAQQSSNGGNSFADDEIGEDIPF